MFERIRHIPGETLDLDTYMQEFRANWDHIEDFFWKLERIQSFREPGFPSWEAWVAGSWDKALALLRERQPTVIEEFQQDAARGIEFRRVRIIEYPISPYLQWEMHAYKFRVQAGERLRVLEASRLGDLEADGPLAEVVILGTKVLYEVVYDDTNAPHSGRRIIDPIVIRACRAQMASLWEQAEDFLPFFEREIAPLPPPVPDHV
jgi:hypothetical protein